MRLPSRFHRFLAGLLTLAAAVFGLSIGPVLGEARAVESAAQARLVSATDSRIAIEIDFSDFDLARSRQVDGAEVLRVAGMGSFSEPGEPRIPGRIYLAAIPPEASYSLRFTVVSSQPLGRHLLEPVPFPLVLEDDDGETYISEEYRLDAPLYNAGGSEMGVTADPEARIRHQRVLPMRVTPLAYDPASGETVLATRIRVEISLRSNTGGGLFADDGAVPVDESPVWERIYSRVLVNPGQAVKWRTKTRRRPHGMGMSNRSREALMGPLVKLGVRGSGLHRVSADALIDEGLPAGTPVSELHLFKRMYDRDALSETVVDIPYRVVEDPSGTGSVFDGSDWLVFYGQRLMEDTFQNDPREKFTDANIYWVGTSSGPQMALEDVPPGVVSADTATATFPVVQYYEEDNVFFEGTPPGKLEFFFYDLPSKTSVSAPFSIGAIDPEGTFLLKAGFQGGDRARSDRSVKLTIFNSIATTPLDPALVPSKQFVDYQSQVLPGDVIAPGLNTLRIDKTSDRPTIEVLLDWFTIEYKSHYRAMGNVIEFNTGALSGDTSVTVTGLSRTDVMLYDVTDPITPREYRLTPGHLTDVGNGYALSIRESLSSQKRFIATPLDRISVIPDDDVMSDNPSSVIGSPAENGVDVLVVCHADFTAEMREWVRYRQAQGYRVLMADVEDIYDEFNGGVPHARAVKNFIRHFYETGGASFVVLVGDASEDNKRVHSKSGINFVPTESFTEYVGGSFNKDEVVTTDKWYVMLDCDFINNNPPCTDYYPDLILGRLPVGSATEAQIMVDKTLSFEEPSGADFWRRRIIRVADNAFSGAGYYCYVSSEEDFQDVEETAAQMFEGAMPGGFDVVRVFMSERIDEPPHTPGSCELASVLTTRTRSTLTPALIGELNKGATFVSIQAHMNRYLVAHEWLLTSSIASPDGLVDYMRMNNPGRPWILFGMGCHLSDYALHQELDEWQFNGPNGDSFGELLLFRPNKGAIATYASTGYEYLYPNTNFTPLLVSANFENVPTDTMVASNKAQARWILGELMTIAEIENLTRFLYAGSGGGAIGQMKRYHLLGDPVLRIDAGPPRFDVTVNDAPFESGEVVSGGSESIRVRAVVTDEVAIERLRLEIDGADSTGLLAVTPLVDETLSAARQYEVRFKHTLQAKTYDIVLKAFQAVDTTNTNYHMIAEFIFHVVANATLTVNGRPTLNGDIVPTEGRYIFELGLPVYVDPSLFRVEADGEPVTAIGVTNPDPQDSTTWHVAFSQKFAVGKHNVTLFVEDTSFPFDVMVGAHAGLLDLIPYPNPFVDEVYFVFTNEIQITSGTIDIFTTSGKKVAHLNIAPGSRSPGQNAVRWDGRVFGGGEVANGVYLFVASVNQGGQESTQRGKVVRTR